MAIVGIGIDVCGLDRWQRVAARRPGLVEKVLTPAEAELAPPSQAARFAAKEALAKALGSPGGLAWHDAEVVRGPQGRPAFEVRGSVAARVAELGVSALHLSLSHDAGVATAVVVAEAS